jgi:hypothetical protein
MPVARQLLSPSDGARYRRLALDLEANGDLVLTFHEMGAALEAAWGADDQEITLRIGGKAVPRLAHVLLSERLSGRNSGLAELVALCEEHGVEHELACWT